MILLFNTKIPNKKKINIGLSFIFGLGSTKITLILKKLGFAKSLNILKLTNYQKSKLFVVVKQLNYSINIDLKKQKTKYLTQLIQIRKYKNIKKHFNLKKIK
jgi:small subunit ribosomal protein S13